MGEIMRKRTAYRVAMAAAFVMASASASAAVTSIDLGGATLSGSPSFSTYEGGYRQAPTKTIDLSTVSVTSSGGQVSFAFNPGVDDYYYGGYRSGSQYSISGNIGLPSGFNVTANDGYVLDKSQSGYRISGQVSVTDAASVKLSTGQSFSGKGVRSVPDVYDFTADVKPGGTGPYLLYWTGMNPYSEGPNGTASTFSVADIKVTKVEYYASIGTVPEAGTVSLMALGLAGLALLRRRHT
jgi:PEP-CTERM motif